MLVAQSSAAAPAAAAAAPDAGPLADVSAAVAACLPSPGSSCGGLVAQGHSAAGQGHGCVAAQSSAKQSEH